MCKMRKENKTSQRNNYEANNTQKNTCYNVQKTNMANRLYIKQKKHFHLSN